MTGTVQDAISAVLRNTREPLTLRALHGRLGTFPNGAFAWPRVLWFTGADGAALAERLRRLEAIELQGASEAGCRLAIVAREPADLHEKLALAHKKISDPECSRLRLPSGIYFAAGPKTGKTVLLFPGQGSQFPRMLEVLCVLSPRAAAWLNALDDAYEAAGVDPPSRLVYPPSDREAENRGRLFGDGLMDLEKGAQLSLAASLALFEVLTRLGVRADAMVGHSNGEHAALIAGGAFQFPDTESACRSLCRGGLLLGDLPALPVEESAVAVSNLDRQTLEAVLNRFSGDLYLAMDNAPSQVVLAGRRDAVAAASRMVEAARGIAVSLPFERAWHTPLFQEGANILRGYYEGEPVGRTRTPVYSCLDSRPFPEDRNGIIKRTARQWVSPVFFHQTICRLYEEGVRLFIEVGPGNTLTGLVDDALRGRPHLAVSASSRTRDDLLQIQHLAAELFAYGALAPVDIVSALGAESAPVVKESPARTAAAESILALHRKLIEEASASQERVRIRLFPNPAPTGEYCRLDLTRFPLLADHSFGRSVSLRQPHRRPLSVVPFFVSLELLAEAAGRCRPGTAVLEMSDVRAHHWLALDRGALEIEITMRGGDPMQVQILQSHRREAGLAFEGSVHFGARAELRPLLRPCGGNAARLNVADFYRDFAFHGPMFQGLERVTAVSASGIEADLQVTNLRVPGGSSLRLNPALLDCAGQLVAFWLLEQNQRDFGVFPIGAQRVSFAGPPLRAGTRIRGRAHIERLRNDVTDATVEFLTSQGDVVARVEHLQQRIIPFPKGWNALLTHSADAVFLSRERHGAAIFDLPDWSLLYAHGGIWALALAHLTLSDEELRDWRDLSETGRPLYLLERVAAKDTIRRWASARGHILAPADIHLTATARGQFTVSGSMATEFPDAVFIERGKDLVRANLAAQESAVGLTALGSGAGGRR